MKFNSLKRLLGLVFVLITATMFFLHFSSCKKDDTVQTTLYVTVLDSLEKPVSSAKVTVYIKPDTSNGGKPKPVQGLPKTQYTDAAGKTTFTFENGLIVFIDAEKDGLFETSFATMAPGETYYRKIILRK